MKLWTRPDCYVGATWEDWFVFLSRHRDSDLLTNSNFECALERVQLLATEVKDGPSEDDRTSGVRTVKENHWAVGWVEWIAIHRSQWPAIAEAERIESKLENYCILDEFDLSEREMNAYFECWANIGADEFRRELEKAELVEDGALDKCTDAQLMDAFEALIRSGEYYDPSDGCSNIHIAIETAKRDGLSDEICKILNLETQGTK